VTPLELHGATLKDPSVFLSVLHGCLHDCSWLSRLQSPTVLSIGHAMHAVMHYVLRMHVGFLFRSGVGYFAKNHALQLSSVYGFIYALTPINMQTFSQRPIQVWQMVKQTSGSEDLTFNCKVQYSTIQLYNATIFDGWPSKEVHRWPYI